MGLSTIEKRNHEQMSEEAGKTWLILVILDRHLKDKIKLHATFSCYQQRNLIEIQIRSNDKNAILFWRNIQPSYTEIDVSYSLV